LDATAENVVREITCRSLGFCVCMLFNEILKDDITFLQVAMIISDNIATKISGHVSFLSLDPKRKGEEKAGIEFNILYKSVFIYQFESTLNSRSKLTK